MLILYNNIISYLVRNNWSNRRGFIISECVCIWKTRVRKTRASSSRRISNEKSLLVGPIGINFNYDTLFNKISHKKLHVSFDWSENKSEPTKR